MEMFKEFHEHNTFVRSLNNTFLVLIPKKSGVEDLGDFRPISLLGGLYKLLAKVLANRLKKVIGKVVSSAQNAFVMGRQILDASLIANEVIDSWQKRKEKGLICKLDIEKAYDSINWNFLMKVFHKMGFGNKWVGWMWSCVSSAKFSILVNGVPAGFFPSTRGLCQGDPLSPYLFVMGMEILDVLIRRAVEGGYLSGRNIRGGSRTSMHISHLFFADDTIVFCEASKDQVSHLSWIFFWFEAVSGLRMNLAKSEIIPVGEVEEILELAAELGCRVGSLPSQYLGLPLGVPNRASSMWDGVEERVRRRLALWKRQYISKGGRITLIKSTLASMPIYQMSIFRMPKSVAKRVEKIQRDFLWGGGNLEGKIHLVKWDVVCTEKRNGGLGLRRIATLNRALLGKWTWRFACERDNLWKQVISTKYGQEEHGWRAKKVSGAAGVGVWKEIMKESEWCWENLAFLVGKGSKIKFWKDSWCTDTPLSQCFNHLFVLAVHRDASIEEMWDHHSGQGDWNLVFVRDFNDWELDMVGDLLHTLRGHRPSLEDDSVKWRQGRNGLFRVKEAYWMLDKPNATMFPARRIWVDRVPTKVCFFAWEATWGKVLTLNRLQIRGVQLPNCCFLCGCEEENVNHILLHCIVTRALWDIIFGLLDIKWVLPETVKEALTSWRGSFVGKKRKQIWKSIPLCIFWTVWKERNRFLGVDSFHLRGVQSIDHKNELAASMPYLKGPFGHSPVVRMVISKFRLYVDCLPLPSILSSLAQYISETSVDKINLPISLGMMGTTLLLPSPKTSPQGSPNIHYEIELNKGSVGYKYLKGSNLMIVVDVLLQNKVIVSDPLANVDKEKTDILMYCTGGIRCDVYSAILRQRGFQNLYTLKGGVSHYLEKEGPVEWIGNLFVFDSRLSLPPSTYKTEAVSETSGAHQVSEGSTFARCYICNSQLHELRHRNCANLDCNLLFCKYKSLEMRRHIT
ncbi:Rhodanese-like domain-containing protein 8, chloroplastic [Vitis vinifera]|uniref:Rhodanese-like domain-containing protein 8, chloroplastic n=1 Tax=Vitis vinifera TaxID=29760 RepID=A0A438GIR0_VITVI|nr:Rhodanese-like domain-containing protein 8, chloroplastic [Vitis vinifera]